jgi:hypothetical protein
MHELAVDLRQLRVAGRTDEVVTRLGMFRALRDQMSELLSSAILRQAPLPV